MNMEVTHKSQCTSVLVFGHLCNFLFNDNDDDDDDDCNCDYYDELVMNMKINHRARQCCLGLWPSVQNVENSLGVQIHKDANGKFGENGQKMIGVVISKWRQLWWSNSK